MALNNVKFLQGSYAALSALETSQVGAFYITNDTHEMFLGVDANKKPVALNRFIDVCESWADIQIKGEYKEHPGKFYYAKQENVLCIWDGDNWTQINPDTDTDTKLSKVEVSEGNGVTWTEGDGENAVTKKGVEYTFTFTQKDVDDKDLANPITAKLVLSEDDVTSLIVDVNVGLDVEVDSGIATISTVGTGSDDTKKVAVSSGNGVTISGTDDGFKIDATTYTLNSKDAKVVLTDNDNKDIASVEFTGDNWIKTETVLDEDGNATNVINVSHKAPVAAGAKDVTTTADTAKSIDSKLRTFTAVTSVQADDNGHITGAKTTEFTIPNSVYTIDETQQTLTVGEGDDAISAKYTTEISLFDGDSKLVGEAAKIETAHKITVDGETRIVTNGGTIGDFYSASQIDSKLKAVDAMVYKGVVNSDSELPVADVQIGHTYKAGKAFTLNGATIATGDLLIANGVEGDVDIDGNAYIAEGTLTWDHVQSGADADTTYTFSGAENKITLKNNVDSTAKSIAVEGDTNYISATVSDDKISISHKNVTVEDAEKIETALDYKSKFNTITGVIRDAAGHVTGVQTTEFEMPAEDSVKLAKDVFEIVDGDDKTKGKVTFVNGNKTTVESEVSADGTELTVKFNHNKLTEAPVDEGTDDDNVAVSLNGANNTFEVLDSVKVDDYGHITGYVSKTVTIGKETTYTLSTPTLSDNVVTQQLTDSDSKAQGGMQLASDTLTYNIDSDNKVHIDVTWGSF